MVLIKLVWFDNENIFVEMTDGQVISKPINLYPNLRKGTQKQLSNYLIEGNGRWLHWEELDEDLSVEGFLSKQEAR